MNEIEPSYGYDLEGFKYVGRGCGPRGWSRRPWLYYRCAQCGDMMPATHNDYFYCKCRAMSLDIHAGRFGSKYGDQNTLSYEKNIVLALYDMLFGQLLGRARARNRKQ